MQNEWVADIYNTLSVKALRNVQDISADIFETGFAIFHLAIIHKRPLHIMTVENGNITIFFRQIDAVVCIYFNIGSLCVLACYVFLAIIKRIFQRRFVAVADAVAVDGVCGAIYFWETLRRKKPFSMFTR